MDSAPEKISALLALFQPSASDSADTKALRQRLRKAAEDLAEFSLDGLQIERDSPRYKAERDKRVASELVWAEAIGLLKLKKETPAESEATTEGRLLETMGDVLKGVLNADKERRHERNLHDKLRGRLLELAHDENMIQRFATAREDEDKRRLRTSTKEQRLALLVRLETPAERESLIDDHLADLCIEGGATRQERENVNAYLDTVRDWLREHEGKNAKAMDKLSTEIAEETKDLCGQLAPSPQEFDDEYISQWFNYPLADELAEKEPIPDERDGDRHALRGVLRMIGHAMALRENVEWTAAMVKLRAICGASGFDSFTNILWCMIPGLRTEFPHPFTLEDCTDFLIDSRFKNALARFCWILGDPKTIRDKQSKQTEHANAFKRWGKEARAAKLAGREAPAPPMTEDEREMQIRKVVLVHRRRGGEWLHIAEKLVELGLETLKAASGERYGDCTSTKRQRALALRALADRLKAKHSRRAVWSGKSGRRKP